MTIFLLQLLPDGEIHRIEKADGTPPPMPDGPGVYALTRLGTDQVIRIRRSGPHRPINCVLPQVTETPEYGVPLTADRGVWIDADEIAVYWAFDGAKIAGSDGLDTITPDQEGPGLYWFVVRASNAQGVTEVIAIAPAYAGPFYAPTFLVSPAIAGIPQPGQLLTVSWDGDGRPAPDVAIQWYLDGAELLGATGAITACPEADEGALITCTVRLTNDLGTAEETAELVVTAWSIEGTTIVIHPAPAAAPVVLGTTVYLDAPDAWAIEGTTILANPAPPVAPTVTDTEVMI